jgi:hypothetical protein
MSDETTKPNMLHSCPWVYSREEPSAGEWLVHRRGLVVRRATALFVFGVEESAIAMCDTLNAPVIEAIEKEREFCAKTQISIDAMNLGKWINQTDESIAEHAKRLDAMREKIEEVDSGCDEAFNNAHSWNESKLLAIHRHLDSVEKKFADAVKRLDAFDEYVKRNDPRIESLSPQGSSGVMGSIGWRTVHRLNISCGKVEHGDAVSTTDEVVTCHACIAEMVEHRERTARDAADQAIARAKAEERQACASIAIEIANDFPNGSYSRMGALKVAERLRETPAYVSEMAKNAEEAKAVCEK